jgi:hypothetical protein
MKHTQLIALATEFGIFAAGLRDTMTPTEAGEKMKDQSYRDMKTLIINDGQYPVEPDPINVLEAKLEEISSWLSSQLILEIEKGTRDISARIKNISYKKMLTNFQAVGIKVEFT